MFFFNLFLTLIHQTNSNTLKKLIFKKITFLKIIIAPQKQTKCTIE